MSGGLIAIQLSHCENSDRAPEIRGAVYGRRSSLAFVRYMLKIIFLLTYDRTPFRSPDSTVRVGGQR
jgi:hypothetical protein